MPEKLASAVKNEAAFDPQKETTRARIRIIDREDGGKEFILPAFRNFKEKFDLLILWLAFGACLAVVLFINEKVVGDLPAVLRFIVINHTYVAIGILGFIELCLTVACVDTWLRSSRIMASADKLQVITHWGFVKRAVTIPTAKIIEIKEVNNASMDQTLYYKIVVLSTGEKPGWLAKKLPPAKWFTENELKVYNTGGKNVTVATDIQGEVEAEWLRSQLCAALKVDFEKFSSHCVAS